MDWLEILHYSNMFSNHKTNYRSINLTKFIILFWKLIPCSKSFLKDKSTNQMDIPLQLHVIGKKLEEKYSLKILDNV